MNGKECMGLNWLQCMYEMNGMKCMEWNTVMFVWNEWNGIYSMKCM